MKKIFITLLAVFMLFSAFACSTPAVQDSSVVHDADLDATIVLSSNPSTGCTWQYKAVVDGIIDEVSVTDETLESELVGGTIVNHTYTFKGLKEGETELTFKYGHSWTDSEYYSIRTFKCTVDSNLLVTFKEIAPTQSVALPGNVTTGYQWVLYSISDNVRALDFVYIQDASDPEMTGVGGTFYFPVVGVSVGSCTAQFNYIGPDGQTVAETKEFTLTVADDLTVTISPVE